MKKKAVRSIIILFVVVFVCLFFGKTLENLSTAKARFVRPTNGRMLKENKLDAKLVFENQTKIIPELAEKYPVTIKGVYFSVGNKVAKGDVMFDASINDFDKKLEDLNTDLAKKNADLLELDAKNAKFPKQSEKGNRYFALRDASKALSEKKAEIAIDARINGKEIDKSLLKPYENAFNQAQAAYMQYARIGAAEDPAFDYIVKRQNLVEDIAKTERNIEDLYVARTTLSEIKAEQDGVITELSIKPGETYNGTKALYTISAENESPVLQAMVNDVDDEVEKGDRALIKGEWSQIAVKILKIGKNKDGQKYINFELPQSAIDQFSGIKKMMEMEKIQVTIQKRSPINTTLLPASALRQEGNSYYVFTTEYKDNGLLGSYQVVKKTPVTVLEKNDTTVSISENLMESVLDREDRPLKENMRVMELSE